LAANCRSASHDSSEEVDSSDKVGIFDPKLKVERAEKGDSWCVEEHSQEWLCHQDVSSPIGLEPSVVATLLRTNSLIGDLVDQNNPTPLFFVSVASKRLSVFISPLFATHTKAPVSVASKELSDGL
jgi:hypothetical protein